ncbi:MAG: RNA-binding protein, partial [Cyanobacteria bacterium P01_H01_bin.15]
MTIYIGNLSYRVEKSDLQEIFEDYGTVTNIKLPIDREKG